MMTPGILALFDIGGKVNHGDIDIVSWHLFANVEEELDLSLL